MSARTPSFTGTTRLTLLALRRDRVMIPSWALGVTALALTTASSFKELYPTVDSRVRFGASIESNGGLLALTGRVHDATTIGGLVGWRIAGSGALLVAIMSMLLVVRHTRAEEEADRLELLGSAVVGRLAPLLAGVLTAVVANTTVVVLIAVSLAALGLPLVGSLALGLGFASCGVVFTAVAAIAAQLTETARAANGITSALIGAAYLLRATGDSTDAGWLSWLSPMGWSQLTRPFADERWWVPVMALAVAATLATVGFRMAARRDLGEGVLPTRPGPARATRSLRSPLALAWRLQRGSLMGWSLGFAVLGAVFGALAVSTSELVEDNPELADVIANLGGSQVVVDAFLATVIAFASFAAAAYAVQAVLRLHGEEFSRRAEPLLATPVGRIRWALGHLLLSLVGVTVLMGVLGLSAGLVYGARAGDIGGQVPRAVGAALVQVFAIWLFAALVMAVFGLVPRWAPAGWGVIGAALLIYFVGALADLNHWVKDLSPFTHLPQLPGGEFTWTPLIWLTVVIIALCAVGLSALHRRDIG